MMSVSEGSAQARFEQAFRHALEGDPDQARRHLRFARTLDRTQEIPEVRYAVVECLIALRQRDPAAARTHAERACAAPEGRRLLNEAVELPGSELPARTAEMLGDLLREPAGSAAKGSAWPLSGGMRPARLVILFLLAALLTSAGFGSYRLTTGGWPGGSEPGSPDYAAMRGQVALVLLEFTTHHPDGHQQTIRRPEGSAFVAGHDGLLLTNAHVVDAVREMPAYVDGRIVVAFSEDPEDHHEARLYHRSEYVDVAVLKVEREFDEVLRFAPAYREGDDVFAFGFPGEGARLAQELSPGARREQVARELEGLFGEDRPDVDTANTDNYVLNMFRGGIGAVRETEMGKFIQSDAVVHAGMSGGPLVDARGRVVGMVTLRHREAEGLSLALAWESVREHIEQIRGISWPQVD